MNLSEFQKQLNSILPIETAMEGDKVGLQLQTGKTEIEKILVAYELNDEVIDEAVESNSDCIVCFHPLIYRPLQTIFDDERVGHLCIRLIQNNIALISVHTCFDVYENGTSRLLSDFLGLKFISTLIPDKKYPEKGMGVIAEYDKPYSMNEFLEKINQICCSPIRYCTGRTNQIRRVAIVGGSGSSFIDQALMANVDAFITADLTYHMFHACNNKIMLVDPGHYEMEQFIANALSKLLKNEFTNLDIMASSAYTNPVNYFPAEDYQAKQKMNISNYQL